jgi:hypothetical protein
MGVGGGSDAGRDEEGQEGTVELRMKIEEGRERKDSKRVRN